ncbi:hypothetical protein [Aequorivita echinoideorum]|uniref:Uncharacterized protein n=1 Tax=Aequorivita echinoideorum TaxID=1549647 RepID=A0ABS5S9S6_9FLAO|nr:hypothetical protein [Aequorivita echinoideorum]MBT0608620.1 hypothetical protein [Aequorivita echinoideorum]
MANLSYNLIHETLDETRMSTIFQKLEEIKALLPLGTLTPEERKQYRSLDVRNHAFVEDAIRVQKNLGENLLPADLKSDAMETDFLLGKQIKSVRERVKNIENILADVARIVDHESFGMASTQYKLYKVGAKVGIPNARTAVEELRWRFENQGGRTLDIIP